MVYRNRLIAAGAGGVLTLVGALVFSASMASGAPAPTYPRNAKGQTYGSAADARSSSEEPDLILVMMSDGREGYVLKTDLEGSMPKNPAEAVAMQKATDIQRSSGDIGRNIKVYASDGTTEVGLFKAGS